MKDLLVYLAVECSSYIFLVYVGATGLLFFTVSTETMKGKKTFLFLMGLSSFAMSLLYAARLVLVGGTGPTSGFCATVVLTLYYFTSGVFKGLGNSNDATAQ